jgi:signal transduction histidine kinase
VNTPLSPPTLRAILAGSFVLVLGAAATAWSEPGSTAGWPLAGAFLVLASTASWVVYRQAAAVSAQRARIEHLEARWKGIAVEQERFVARLAHEIRTPMSIVLNEAELIFACSDDPAAVRDNAKSIVQYVSHLAALCDRFLRLEDPFANGDTSDHLPVHIHDAVVEAVRATQATARGRGVRIVATLADSRDNEAALEVLGNPVLLTAMIENLVRNAVRCTRSETQVQLQVSARGESIVLQVRSHGAAIAPAQLASAFDWFPAPGTVPPAAGFSVGLAIAKRVAEHHRGTISLQNHPEGGCEFELSLPRWRGDGGRRERSAGLAANTAAGPA